MSEPAPGDDPSPLFPGDPAAIDEAARRLAALAEEAARAAVESRALGARQGHEPGAAEWDAMADLMAAFAQGLAAVAGEFREVDVGARGPFRSDGTDALLEAIDGFSGWMEREAQESWDAADFFRTSADELRRVHGRAGPGLVPRPEAMWLSSTDHPSWGQPRLVQPKRLVTGPVEGRDYLWLSVEPVDRPTPDGAWGGSDVVVTPRFDTSLHRPEPGRPVEVHVWVARDVAELAAGRFRPGKVAADAWCSLYADEEEAAAKAAPPW